MHARTRPVDDEGPEHDDIIVFRGISWRDYERLLAMRGDNSAPRITYLEGLVEVMTPSRTHEGIKSTIGSLVEAWCLQHDLRFSAYGSWTLKDKAERRGVEPDECYVLGAEETERPHLAIEVIWTSGGLDKLDVYRRLGVREVWVWRKNRLQAHVLRGDRYLPLVHSEVLPGIDIDQLATFLDRPTTFDAIREYRAAIASPKD